METKNNLLEVGKKTINDQKEEYLRAYRLYSDEIYRFCYMKLSDREKATDMMQDTFIKVWEYIINGNVVNNIRAFLYKVASNLIIDGFRKRKTLSLDELNESGFDAGFNDSDHINNTIDGKKAFELIDLMADKYKDVIIMRYVQDLSIKEIADILDEKENNISVRLHRAVEKLKELYKERDKEYVPYHNHFRHAIQH